MKITKLSLLSGKTHTLDIPVNESQIEKWQKGELIQSAMPNVPPPLREFMKTGITPEEWNKYIGEV